jgi:hypothetical protein
MHSTGNIQPWGLGEFRVRECMNAIVGRKLEEKFAATIEKVQLRIDAQPR